MTTYLKRWKMHENWGQSFFCPTYKKMISPYIEWCIGKYPGVCTIFLKKQHMVPKVYALSRCYLECWGYFRFVFHFYDQPVLWGLDVEHYYFRWMLAIADQGGGTRRAPPLLPRTYDFVCPKRLFCSLFPSLSPLAINFKHTFIRNMAKTR